MLNKTQEKMHNISNDIFTSHSAIWHILNSNEREALNNYERAQLERALNALGNAQTYVTNLK